MKYYVIAGEASGDLHGSNLMRALLEIDPEARFRVWGGDLMEQAGGTLVKHYRDLAFMGFVEVLKNLRTILGNIKFCKEDILRYQPDALILVDYPGFNLRIADWAHKMQLPVHYYISPQIWAWHSSRVKKIKKNVDRMYVILPFEEAFYQKYDYPVDFVGHPLLDVIREFSVPPEFRIQNGLTEAPIIALLPGSRKQEIRRMLTTMLTVPASFPGHQFVIAGAPAIPPAYYQEIIGQFPGTNVSIVHNQTYALLHEAAAALVTSGTATLETALFSVPQIVCYRGNNLSFQLAKRLINVKYISLVNLILDRPLVSELIQHDFHTAGLISELTAILEGKKRTEVMEGYADLKRKLGGAGASMQTAQLITSFAQAKKM